MIRFDKFTQKAREAVEQSQTIAGESEHQQMSPLHLLIALVEQEEGIAGTILAKLGAEPAAMASDAREGLRSLPQVSGSGAQGGMYTSPSLNEVFQQSQKEAEQFKDEYISTEHLLLAVSRLKHDPAADLLTKAGAGHEAILRALASVRGSQRVTDPNPEAKYQALERYSLDLTEQASIFQSNNEPEMGLS